MIEHGAKLNRLLLDALSAKWLGKRDAQPHETYTVVIRHANIFALCLIRVRCSKHGARKSSCRFCLKQLLIARIYLVLSVSLQFGHMR